MVARFAGLAEDTTLDERVDVRIRMPRGIHWARGNRAIECNLYLKMTVTRSLKGAGPEALPVR